MLQKYAEEDYFKYLPEEIRPKGAMLLWGTKYSRSKLHIDPYNWTGTIALLSGTKRWKVSCLYICNFQCFTGNMLVFSL